MLEKKGDRNIFFKAIKIFIIILMIIFLFGAVRYFLFIDIKHEVKQGIKKYLQLKPIRPIRENQDCKIPV